MVRQRIISNPKKYIQQCKYAFNQDLCRVPHALRNTMLYECLSKHLAILQANSRTLPQLSELHVMGYTASGDQQDIPQPNHWKL